MGDSRRLRAGKGYLMPSRRTFWSVLLFAGLLLLSACGPQTSVDSSDSLDEYFAATSEAELTQAIDRLVASDEDPNDVARWLRAGPDYPADVPTGWTTYEIEGPDGRLRPYHVYVPTTYDREQSYPLLFDLHGAVSSAPQPAEYLEQRRRLWEGEAEELGWILIVPHGDRYASWFSANGHANLLGELAFVKRRINVDENRVFVSGFSDGGSGAYWLGFHDPTPWAALISFHGHPGVGGYGPYQTYPRNLLNRPIRATTGETDELYPPDNVSSYVTLLERIGVDIEWTVYPGGHDAQFLSDEAEHTIALISQTSRNPYPAEVIWETSDVAVGRCDWVRIDEIADVGNDEAFEDINLAEIPEQIVFGAAISYRGGTLFTVAGLEPDSAAFYMGIKTGDQILTIDGMSVLTQDDIGVAMIGKAPGDPVEVEIVRDGEPMVLTGHIPAADLIYGRDEMTASVHVTASGNDIDVRVSHVGRYTLLISSEQFDLDRPITVTTNGDVTFSDVVQPDLRFMLEQAAEDFDRKAVYEASIEIAVPQLSN